MKEVFLGTYGDQAIPRCMPFNVGDGLLMGLSVGAELTRGLGRFYGNVAPWPSILPTSADAWDAMDKEMQWAALRNPTTISANAVLVNLNGKRFADEVTPRHINGGACWASENLLKQPQGLAFMIADAGVVRDIDSQVEPLEELGAVVLKADTFEELADQLAAYDVNRANFLATMDEWNNSPVEELEIPNAGRTGEYQYSTAGPLVTPPFYALQVTTAISAPFGGLKIDPGARVLGHDGLPIHGLYATACCAGGIVYDDYLGSLGASTVFGVIAARSAMEDMNGQ